MRAHSASTPRVTSWIAAGVLALAGMPAACLFPTYTFDLHGAGGGVAGAGGTGGSGGSGGGTEDCTNGKDDDDDGLVDCEDPKCGAFACVNAIPMGWQGYVALYDGLSTGDPGCSGNFPRSVFTGHGGLQTKPASCSTCTCSAPANELCAIPDIVVSDASCTGASNCTPKLPVPSNWDGSCVDITTLPGGVTTCGNGSCTAGSSACHVSVHTAAPVVSGGACMASKQQVTKSMPVWGTAGEACANDASKAAGCPSGQACLPKPGSKFEKGLCIYQTGDSTCPPGPFTHKHLFFQDVTDTRTCTDCACGAPSGSTCTIQIKVYAGTTCTGGLLNSFTAGGCASLGVTNPAVGAHQATIIQAPTGGMCTPSGGQPMGAETPISPTTFCCAD